MRPLHVPVSHCGNEGRNSLIGSAVSVGIHHDSTVKQLEYHLALEKAILEYAASVTAHTQTRTDRIIQIPGYIDAHVWGMAAQLSEWGYIKVSEPDDGRAVCVSVLNESGAIRLKELTAEEQQLVEAKRIQMEDAIERAKQKKWWRHLTKRRKVSVQN